MAAVILEPTMRDMEPKPGFLETIQETTTQNDVLLVFDEVISFRLSIGGAQEYFKVKPDITTMGKIIGGGFPVGAYASTEETLTPLRIPETNLPETASPKLGFSGTFNAFPLAMTAGLAVLQEMTKRKYAKIARRGAEMRKGLRNVIKEEGINIQVGGAGSFFNLYWTNTPVCDHETSTTIDRGLTTLFNIGMMNYGIYILGHPNVSTAQTKAEIKSTTEAARRTIQEMKPNIKQRAPHLLI